MAFLWRKCRQVCRFQWRIAFRISFLVLWSDGKSEDVCVSQSTRLHQVVYIVIKLKLTANGPIVWLMKTAPTNNERWLRPPNSTRKPLLIYRAEWARVPMCVCVCVCVRACLAAKGTWCTVINDTAFVGHKRIQITRHMTTIRLALETSLSPDYYVRLITQLQYFHTQIIRKLRRPI